MHLAPWRGNPRLPFYGVAALSAIGLVMLELHLQSGQTWGVQVDQLSDFQKKEFDVFTDMHNLLTTLETGLLGALFLLVSRRRTALSGRELLPACLSALCVGISLAYGYQSYQDLLLMLDYRTVDFTSPVILWDRHGHFYMFGLAVLFFADFVFHELTKVNKNEPHPDVAGT